MAVGVAVTIAAVLAFAALAALVAAAVVGSSHTTTPAPFRAATAALALSSFASPRRLLAPILSLALPQPLPRHSDPATLDNGSLRIYSGTAPADADAALAGNTLLASLPLGATAFGAASAVAVVAHKFREAFMRTLSRPDDQRDDYLFLECDEGVRFKALHELRANDHSQPVLVISIAPVDEDGHALRLDDGTPDVSWHSHTFTDAELGETDFDMAARARIADLGTAWRAGAINLGSPSE